MLRIFAAVLLILVLPGMGGCAWLETKQNEWALRPSPTLPGTPPIALREGDERWLASIASAGGGTDKVALWWLPQAKVGAPTLLYLHGTFRDLPRNLPKIEALREAGFSVLAVEYRGWGDSTPIIPNEASINADAALAWAELQRRQPEATKRVIFGHSMGGAVAVSLASRLRAKQDYAGLILESTFTRLPDVAAAAGRLGRIAASLTTLEFDSLAKITRVDAPILMMHGDADNTVPVILGRQLRDAAPAAQVTWEEFLGGTHSRLHSEFPLRYQTTVQSFLRALNRS
jgi:uncharacterized protein